MGTVSGIGERGKVCVVDNRYSRCDQPDLLIASDCRPRDNCESVQKLWGDYSEAASERAGSQSRLLPLRLPDMLIRPAAFLCLRLRSLPAYPCFLRRRALAPPPVHPAPNRAGPDPAASQNRGSYDEPKASAHPVLLPQCATGPPNADRRVRPCAWNQDSPRAALWTTLTHLFLPRA